MENFIYDIKTKIYFGKGSISHLSEAVRPYGKKRCWSMAAAASNGSVCMTRQ